MQDRKLVAFVGMPGSGKSTLVDYLKDKGLPSAYFGGIAINEVKARGLEVNEANEKHVREDIRAKEGRDAFAVRIIAEVEQHYSSGHDRVVVDGLYSWTEYKSFKEKFGNNAIIIAVVAKRSLRHSRLANRPERPLSEEEATGRDYAEIENLEKGGPIANADYYIVNETSVEELISNLNKILKETDYFK